jgi:hypothetical protein
MPFLAKTKDNAGDSMKRRRFVARAATLTAALVLAAGWIWCLLSLWLHPEWPRVARTGASIAWIAASGVGWWFLRGRRFAAAVFAGWLVVAVGWSFVAPSNERVWSPDQERLPRVTLDGDTITIDNLRDATYRSRTDYDVDWIRDSFDLRTLSSLDFVLEPLGSRAVAHTFLTFGFEDGRHVAISVEIRKERGERYSPLTGLFRHFEIVYVVGTERDLIGLRANVREHDVYLFPIRADRKRIRELFVSMLERADRLRDEPEFYNSLTNTCFSSIIDHVNELVEEPIRFDRRVLLPGYADELLFERRAVDFAGSLEEARRAFRVNDRAAFGASSVDWSRQIRSGAVGEVRRSE